MRLSWLAGRAQALPLAGQIATLTVQRKGTQSSYPTDAQLKFVAPHLRRGTAETAIP